MHFHTYQQILFLKKEYIKQLLIINLFRARMKLSGHIMNLAWDAVGCIFSTDANTNTNY